MPDDLCDAIIASGKDLVQQDGLVGGKSDLDDGYVDKESRTNTVGFFPEGHWLEGLVSHYVNKANKQAWNFRLSSCQTIQFATYTKNDFYGFHCDTFQLAETMRKLSICIQLSDPLAYCGGEFEFQDDPPLEPEGFVDRGSIIVFPSFLFHRVAAITDGTRHSLVSWVLGPQFI